jgi:glycosyltransferase involved in cell wall biosynthesis
MKVLFLTQVLPYPLDAGPKIRAYYTLRYLSRQHEVTLLSFVRPSDPPEAVEHLQGLCRVVYTVPMRRSRARDAWHLLRSLAKGVPFLIDRDWVAEMAQLIKQLTSQSSNFDVVHADQLWMAPYALRAKSRSSKPKAESPKLVLDQHNAVYLIPQRLAQYERNPLKRALLALEGRKLARYEAGVCRCFDQVVFVTGEDQAAVCAQMTKSQISNPHSQSEIRNPKSAIRNLVIPICVDPAAKSAILRIPNAHRVAFVGGLHWPPNAEGVLWFARKVWPRVLQYLPNAVFTVIGKNPPPELTPHASRLTHHVSRFTHCVPDVANCEVTGYVDDPTAYLAETAAFIVPLHAGGGMRVKILDAWSWGLPVVSTRIGAEGLRYQNGENLLIAETAETFARSVVRLFTEPELADRLRAAGRRTVEEHYDWRKVYHAWDKVYSKAVGSQRGGG